jgi:DNA-binding MarR family transcriptional regulator
VADTLNSLMTSVADDGVDARVRGIVEHFPEVDPVVEAISHRVCDVERLLDKAAAANLARSEVTHEEFKVMLALHRHKRSHGSLSQELMVSTGAMTNRLDKLERNGLVQRERDPNDRRGVLLALTDAGAERLESAVGQAAAQERNLLEALTSAERDQLNRLLAKLLAGLQAELGPAPKHYHGPEA